jgi:hypothetical protein
MNTFYMIMLIVGSFTLTKRISELVISIKKKDKEKVKVEVLFLLLFLFVICMLIYIKN